MQSRKTHFEQIPIAIVKKKIAEEELELEENRRVRVTVETPATKTEPYSVNIAMCCRSQAS